MQGSNSFRLALGALAAVLLSAPAPALADLNIVQIAPLSGPLADTGQLLQQGASLAIRDANDKGGIAGQKIRLSTLDDAYKVDETVRLAREAGSAADKPLAFIGLVGTGNFKALLDKKIIDETGIPVIGVRTGASSIRQPHRLVYHLRASYASEVDKLVEIAATIGGKRFGVLYQDDPFGQDGLTAMKAAIGKRGLELVTSSSYEKNTTHVEAAVDSLLKAGNLSAIVLVSNTQATDAFIKAYRDKGGLAQLYTLSVNNDREIVSQISADKARGLGIAQVVPFPFSSVLPIAREYQTLLGKYQPNASPSVTGMEGFIYGKVLVESLRRAGSNPNRESLTKALESRPFELGGYSISFAPGKHEGSQFVELTMIGRDGKLIR